MPKKSKGLYPDAHPTAPGGMSRKDLIAELVNKHGHEQRPKDEWGKVSWPDLIQFVIDGRLAAEAEQHFGDAVPTIEAGDVLDPEALLDEIEAAQDKTPPLFLGVPGVRDYVFAGHAGAGPSGAERWMNCTMSLTASRKFLETLSPNQRREFAAANTAARQGTTAHAVGEMKANFLLGRVEQVEMETALLELSLNPDEGEEYDDEMDEYVNEYVDLVKTYAQERGGENVLIESRVEATIPLTDMREGSVYVIRGSADMLIRPTADEPSLVVGDLKYGIGKDVDVDENPQIRLYALGALEKMADPETGDIPDWFDDVIYHIIQPRLGGIKTWRETVDELLEWRDETLAPALTRALYGADEGATFEPSDLACQWCPARGTCPSLAEKVFSEGTTLFDTVQEAEYADGPGAFPETTSLTDARLGELLRQVSGLVDIQKSLKEEAQRRLHRGNTIPGFQLVSYTPPRRWKSGALEALEDVEVWREPALLTPTQAIKNLGDDKAALSKIEKYIDTPDKRPVIAKEGDRRKTWTGKPPEQMFDVEGSETE